MSERVSEEDMRAIIEAVRQRGTPFLAQQAKRAVAELLTARRVVEAAEAMGTQVSPPLHAALAAHRDNMKAGGEPPQANPSVTGAGSPAPSPPAALPTPDLDPETGVPWLWHRDDVLRAERAAHAAEVARLEKGLCEARTDVAHYKSLYYDMIPQLNDALATAPAGWSEAKVRADIAAAAERHYCRGLELARKPECLGWEAKVNAGSFGKAEMDAHAEANREFGRHQGMHEALRALDAEPQPAQGGREEARNALATAFCLAIDHGHRSAEQCADEFVDALDRYLAARKEA